MRSALCCLITLGLGLTTASPVQANPVPLICRGNSAPTIFAYGKFTTFSFVPELFGPVTANGLQAGHCGFVDRALRSDEPRTHGVIEDVAPYIQAGKVTQFLQTVDPYVYRAVDSTKYYFLYISGTNSDGFTIASSVGDAMDDAPYAVLSGSTGTATGSTALPMLRNDFTPTCAASSAPDVYYHLPLSATTRVQANTFNSSFDTVLSIINANGTTLACNDDAWNTVRQSLVDVTLPAGDYYIVIDGYAAATGNYTLATQLN